MIYRPATPLVLLSLLLLLWQPCVVTAAPTTAPAQASHAVIDRAMKSLVAGDQASAEHVIMESIASAIDSGKNPDVEEVFLSAVMTRSRFEIREAAPAFDYVREHSPKSPHGQAATCILLLDSEAPGLERNFAALLELSTRQPPDPLLLWMVGVQSRSLNRNEIGVSAYAQLCKQWNPGPVLVHQTYANLLDALSRSEEAVSHRQLAVQLEPEPWSYDGLGNTLTALKRWKEADDAFAHSTSMAPNDPHYWRNWSISKMARGDLSGAAALAEKVRKLEKTAGQ
jgi:tetratricopeptide (TPR) repeat protein